MNKFAGVLALCSLVAWVTFAVFVPYEQQLQVETGYELFNFCAIAAFNYFTGLFLGSVQR